MFRRNNNFINRPVTLNIPALPSLQQELRIKVFSSFESQGNFEYEQIPRNYALHFIVSGLGEFVCDGKS